MANLYVVYDAVNVPPELTNYLLDRLPPAANRVLNFPVPLFLADLDDTDLEMYVVFGRIPINLDYVRETGEDAAKMDRENDGIRQGLVLYQRQRGTYLISGSQKHALVTGTIFRLADNEPWETVVDQNDDEAMIYVLKTIDPDEEEPPHAFGISLIEELMVELPGVPPGQAERVAAVLASRAKAAKAPEVKAATSPKTSK